MKKILLGASVCLSMITSIGKAQQIQPCGTYQAQEYFIKNMPGYKERLEALKNNTYAQRTNTLSPTDTIFVPVVFHILHQNGPENLNDNVLINTINFVNKDFARLGSDTASINPAFKALYVNSFLKFVLAKKDPNGNCTNGIVHHYDAATNWDQGNILNYKYSTTAPGGWRPDKYLNIYIVKNIIDDGGSAGMVVGYTYIPGSSPVPASDAIVYRYDFLNNFISARSMSHEIGHWLGLSHTFGSTNNPGESCGDDGILDTPPTIGFFSTCPGTSAITGTMVCNSQMPNVENIMDYSSCPKNFTQGQTDVMRAAATSNIAGRATLTSTANLVAVGVLNNTVTVCAPIADFVSDKAQTCNGQSVTFTSTSFNGTIGSYSWSFEGGTPSSSSSSSQLVTYTTPGVYGVTLTVTNSEGASTKSVSSMVISNWNADANNLPISETFESGSVSNLWTIKNNDANSPGFKIANYGSQASSKSIMLENYGAYSPNGVDIIESSQLNFSNVTSVALTFDYSYARITGISGDQFIVQYSKDCGGSWSSLPGSPNAITMATNTGSFVNTGSYIPFTSAKWKTQSIPATLLTTLNNTQDVKFRFYFANADGGQTNNLYIDNINISGIVGIHEIENTIGLKIYPNPTSGSSSIEFTSPVNSNVNVLVHDITGRLVEKSEFKSNAGVKEVYNVNASSKLQAGVYLVTLSLDGQSITKKLIIE